MRRDGGRTANWLEGGGIRPSKSMSKSILIAMDMKIGRNRVVLRHVVGRMDDSWMNALSVERKARYSGSENRARV